MSRLIDQLRSRGFSNREARDLLVTGKVFYCDIPTADAGREVDPSQVSLRPTASRIRPGRDLVILFNDGHLAVVWKPAGLLSVGAVGRRREPNVINIVGRLLGAAYPVHRIDEPTSGLMMVARTEACQRQIKELLFHHRVERCYQAIVQGRFQSTPCVVRTQLVRNRGDGLRGSTMAQDDEEGREAVTHLRLLQPLGSRASLIEARLETGRTHQVRIHLSEKHHPILGDGLYGGPGVARAAPRLALHACKLAFRHPVSGATLSFVAPLADDLEILRRQLLHRARGRLRNDDGTQSKQGP